jgi:pimeloyl-ACP methyl ester carboxylesterase
MSTPAAQRPTEQSALLCLYCVQALKAVNVPVLITYGARDALFSRNAADYLEKSFAVTQVDAFASSGHLPHLDEREEYLSTLLPFLRAADAAVA